MGEQNVIDGKPVFDRIGKALDRIACTGLGNPDVAAEAISRAIGGWVRGRKGRLKASDLPFDVAHELVECADAVELVAEILVRREAAQGWLDQARMYLTTDETDILPADIVHGLYNALAGESVPHPYEDDEVESSATLEITAVAESERAEDIENRLTELADVADAPGLTAETEQEKLELEAELARLRGTKEREAYRKAAPLDIGETPA